MCCLLCFDGSPIEGDLKASRQNVFQISLTEGLYKKQVFNDWIYFTFLTSYQPVCCITYLCAPCCTYYTRYRVLDGDMSKYSCCQGYLNVACFRSGTLGESSCPECCLCLESFCCLGPSMSSSRLFIMDQYDLRPDPVCTCYMII